MAGSTPRKPETAKDEPARVEAVASPHLVADRNGQLKPDIAAPGAMIVSCLSADSQVSRAVMVNEDFRDDG